MIAEVTQYGLMAVAMVVVTLAFAGAVAQRPARMRRYYLPVVAIPVVTGVSYLAMSQGILLIEAVHGERVPLGRLLSYLVTFPITMGYIGWAAGVGPRGTGKLAGSIVMVDVGVAINWMLPAYSAVGTVVTIGSLAVMTYLLLGPHDQAARARSEELKLLFGKLRNLLLMLWVMYVALALASRQALGLLGATTGVFLGNYFDLLAVVGFGGIILRATGAMETLIDEYESGEGDPPIPGLSD